MASFIDHSLDENGVLTLRIAYDATRKTLTGGILKNGRDHSASLLTTNVAEMTQLKVGEDAIPLSPAPKGDPDYVYRFEQQISAGNFTGIGVLLKGQKFGQYMLDTGNEGISGFATSKLAAFETRALSGSKGIIEVPYNRMAQPDFAPVTDLHTHLAGNLPSQTLIDLALNKKSKPVTYTTSLLDTIHIETSKYKAENGTIRIGDLDQDDLKKLAAAMSIPVDKQDTFNGMENIYSYRSPITKDKELFKDILREIAKNYAKEGTSYAELSYSNIIGDPDLLRMAHEVLPDIENETGVKLRFLAAMWRHSDREWNQDEVDRIKAIAQSPYIVGADFMGHETNPTGDFFTEIKELAKWSIQHDPDFTIRVHAGENPIFADTGYNHDDFLKNGAGYWANHNVRNALHAVLDARKEIAQELGADLDSVAMPRIRIGHGLYGLDEETVRLFKETGATVEFNMSSNLALNNIDSIDEVPIKRYVDAGIPVVLGHDGKGIYQTSPQQEALLAYAAGLNNADFEHMHRVEANHMERDEERFRRTRKAFNKVLETEVATGMNPDEAFKKVVAPTYSTENGHVRMTSEIASAYRDKQNAREKELLNRISRSYDGHPVMTDPAQVVEDLKNKTPILITGASEKAWPKISQEQQQEIEVAMQVLSNWINPDKAYLITGGTHHGVEARLHDAAHRSPQKVKVLGAFTAEALALKAGQVAKVEDNTVTHATILKMPGNRIAERWFDLQDAALTMIEKDHGEVIAVGGGPVVRDMIQRAHNMGLGLHLMDGPEGASSEKSHTLRSNGYSFKGAAGLLEHLHAKRPDLFRADFDIKKAQAYVEEASQQIEASKPGMDISQAKAHTVLTGQEESRVVI